MIRRIPSYRNPIGDLEPPVAQKAAALVPKLLAEYSPPTMDAEARSELDEFVARRVEEGGVATDC